MTTSVILLACGAAAGSRGGRVTSPHMGTASILLFARYASAIKLCASALRERALTPGAVWRTLKGIPAPTV